MNVLGRLPTLGSGAIRWLTIAALSLTLLALLISLQFVLRTTGGTLFLFSTLAPMLVFVAITIYAGVTLHEYHRAHKLFEIERFQPGQYVFRQGDAGDCAYFIRSGEVEVVVEEDGRVLARLGAGEYFGEMALLSNRPRNATVRTVAPVELAVLGKKNFLNMVRLLPSAEQAILSTVKARAMERGGEATVTDLDSS
jgi:hypothetical protein